MTDSPRRPADIEFGTPGASARARYERLRARDDERRRRRFGRLAPVVKFFVGPKHSTEAWGMGADGEEWIGEFMSRTVGDGGIVLHDRRVPRSRANLDHIAIVPSGVWVIDSKHYRGRLESRTVWGWSTARRKLYVGRREQSKLVASALRQRAEVARHVPADVPVRAVLCFTGVEISHFARPFVIEGVLVSWPKPMARTLTRAGPLDAEARRALATELSRTFRPYAP